MGKASLLMVVGLSIILAIVGVNLGMRSGNAITNAENYYMDAALFSMKTSGANLAVGTVFRRPGLIDSMNIGSTITSYSGPVNMKMRGFGTLQKVGDLRVLVSRPTRDQVTVRSVSTGRAYNSRGENRLDSGITVVQMRRTNFAEYSYFTDFETTPSGTNIWWISGDSVGINVLDTSNGGKVHTNDVMRIDGAPVFFGKVTTGGGRQLASGSNPIFKGGYESGVHIDMPGDFDLIKANTSGGFYKNNGREIWLQFNSNATMTFKYSSGSDTTISIASSPTFNGVIAIAGADVHIKGTVNGSITIAAFETASHTKGNIWIDDDIVYAQDPRTIPSSDDFLGLLADNNIWVTNNTANNTGGCTIQATIMSKNGSFGAEAYDSRAIAGSLRLLGGVIQKRRGPVCTFNSGGSINHGFSKRYYYDGRMATRYPPFFPMTKQFKIYSWWE
jgi:hypothetical protein